MLAVECKKYSRLMLAIQERPFQQWDPPIIFIDEDYEAKRCYEESTQSVEGKRGKSGLLKEQARVHLLELDPRLGRDDTRPQSSKDLKEVQIRSEAHHKTKIERSLDAETEE
ncbi:hypothetical protein CR513_61599, partial [Mucuna pruriens]